MPTHPESKAKRLLNFRILPLALLTLIIFLFINNWGYESSEKAPTEELVEIASKSLLSEPSDNVPLTNELSTELNQEQATDNQSDQLVLIQRPTWKLEGNLHLKYESLKQAADNGDSTAAHVLAMNLRYCYAGPLTESDLQQAIDNVDEYSDRVRSINRLTERFEYCQNINKESRSKFYQYFEIAAKQGFVPTQEVIANITPKLFMESQGYAKLERAEFLKKRDQFIQDKHEYLKSASQQGSLRAMNHLSNMYYYQNFGAGGFVNAYALNQVVLELTDDNSQYNRFSRYQQNLHNKLSAEEIDSGLAKSEELIEKIRQKGTLYSF